LRCCPWEKLGGELSLEHVLVAVDDQEHVLVVIYNRLLMWL
jgi:hypothetical protein